MQLIADVQNRTDAISRAVAEEALEPLTQQPMTPAEVNHARRSTIFRWTVKQKQNSLYSLNRNL